MACQGGFFCEALCARRTYSARQSEPKLAQLMVAWLPFPTPENVYLRAISHAAHWFIDVHGWMDDWPANGSTMRIYLEMCVYVAPSYCFSPTRDSQFPGPNLCMNFFFDAAEPFLALPLPAIDVAKLFLPNFEGPRLKLAEEAPQIFAKNILGPKSFSLAALFPKLLFGPISNFAQRKIFKLQSKQTLPRESSGLEVGERGRADMASMFHARGATFNRQQRDLLPRGSFWHLALAGHWAVHRNLFCAVTPPSHATRPDEM